MKPSTLTLRRSGMQHFHIPAPREANPEPDALVHARLQYGSKVVGASGGNPGLKLPVNFLDGRRIIDGLFELNFQELPGMALRALNSYLSTVFHDLRLMFQRIASPLTPGRD